MKILILDDNEIITTSPADYYVDPHDYRKDTIIQVCHPTTFWEEFLKGGWDEVWLDHDLGSHMFNGRTVTRKIAQLGFDGMHFDTHFVVISMNPVAASSMVSDIAQYTNAQVDHCPVSFMYDRGILRGDAITDIMSVRTVNSIITQPKE